MKIKQYKGLKAVKHVQEVTDAHVAQELENILAKYSIGWNVNRISSLAKAIMELAMFETLYADDVPKNVAIHEAVLLAQKYEEPETVAFVNGILGAFSRDQRPEA